MDKEIWKNIKGYSNYKISNLGRVKSIGNNKSKKEKILKSRKNNRGYLIVNLHFNGKRKTYYIHRLVAQAFLDDYSDDLEVDHINTICTDNRVENLRMCTHKENNNNPLTLKHFSEAKKGENNPMYNKYGFNHSKAKYVYCLELDKSWGSIIECAEELGLYATNITKVCKDKLKTTGGYHFKYIENK